MTLISCGSAGSTTSSQGINRGSGEGATVTNTVTSPSAMQPGDIFQVIFEGEKQAVIDLKGVPTSAQFDLAVMNLATAGERSSIQLSDLVAPLPETIVEPDAAEWHDLSLQEAFEERLRGIELALAAEAPSMSLGKSLAKAAQRAPTIGSNETFRVIASLAGGGTTVEVTGRVACVTSALTFYVDVEIERRNADDLTARDVQTICDNFDKAYAAERTLFGEPSDIDGDGRVAILFTPQVNRLGSSGGGIITGFFYARDLAEGGNLREILYIMVPDSRGTYGTRIEKDFALRNLIPAVLPHEMQHAISYNQHVIVKGGMPEEGWLNEGLSHLAEDLVGFGVENPSRYSIYLQRPSSYGIVSAGSPGLAARGGIFLFLRYLYEQHTNGNAFLQRLLRSEKVGVANLEESYASTDVQFDQFAEFFLRWSTALALNNRGISKDVRFTYADPITAATGNLAGVCTICAPADNRDTQLTGVKRSAYGGATSLNIDPAAIQYYQIASAPGQIRLWSNAKDETFGAVLMRTK